MPTGHEIHAAAVTRDYISQPRISKQPKNSNGSNRNPKLYHGI